MLVEIHVLQNLAPSNPNRDDVGAPKSAMFGGKLRGRISSQCTKRSIRLYPEFKSALKGHLGTRTKFFPELVRVQLTQTKIPSEEHDRIVLKCTQIGKAEAKESGKKEKEQAYERKRTPQLIYLGPGEVRDFVDRLVQLRGEMPQAYKYYLNPVAGFAEIMQAEASESDLGNEYEVFTKLVTNAWVIANCRTQAVEQIEGPDDSDPIPKFSAGNPTPSVAEWIVKRAVSVIEGGDKEKKKRLLELMKGASKDEKKQLTDAEPDKPGDYGTFEKRLNKPLQNKSVDIALFGRMTTEAEAFEDVEACLEVAHALSTNEMTCEVDYFTAMDDDPNQKGPGAAHIGERQFTSNCYYKYFSLDWNEFCAKLAGPDALPDAVKDADKLARTALKALIRAILFAIPTGNKKGHANNNLPDAVLVEVKNKHIPTNYANAFLTPAVPSKEGNPTDDSVRKLGHYAKLVSRGYGIKAKRFWFDLHGRPLSYIVPPTDGKPEMSKPYAEAKTDLDALLTDVDVALAQGAT
jgi:CT1975-like protein